MLHHVGLSQRNIYIDCLLWCFTMWATRSAASCGSNIQFAFTLFHLVVSISCMRPHRYLQGLVLHDVGYENGGSLRPIMHRASLVEMIVP